jgi:hypothetical protein
LPHHSVNEEKELHSLDFMYRLEMLSQEARIVLHVGRNTKRHADPCGDGRKKEDETAPEADAESHSSILPSR